MKTRTDFYLPMSLVVLLLAGCGGSGSSDPVSGTFELSVSIAGAGIGTVTSQPGGIDCGTDCIEAYDADTLVTLTASRAAGSVFAGWSGACSGVDSCEVVMDAARSVTATFSEYVVDCSASASYSPPSTITVPSSTVPASTTIVVLHGKTAFPALPDLMDYYTVLSDKGYDVIAPDLPWSDTDWNGSMCEAMNYLDDLAAQEAANGRDVVIAGHSMGGAHALIYGVTGPPEEVKAVIALAPGHFPHLELPVLRLFDPATAAAIDASVTLAETMVAEGDGALIATFDTLVPDPNNPLVQISATANDYLSYHALDQYPDINDVLPPIKLPVLWLAGADDDLTDLYNMLTLASRITSANSIYMVVGGDHVTMVANTPGPIDDWLLSLGL